MEMLNWKDLQEEEIRRSAAEIRSKLSGKKHNSAHLPAPEYVATAVTAVFWDIVRCPVPLGCDPRVVAPCIKRRLKESGYTGPVTITAIGVLTNVPIDVLRAVSSTGILLNHNANESSTISTDMWLWTRKNPPPANVMIISHGKCFFRSYSWIFEGYNPIRLIPHSWILEKEGLQYWENFLRQDPGEDDGALYPDASWVCTVCLYTPRGVHGSGFECFINHLSSQEHELRLLDWFPLPKQPTAENATTRENGDDEEHAVIKEVDSTSKRYEYLNH